MKAKRRRIELKRKHTSGPPDGAWEPWNLWERGVSWSRLSTWLTCRHQAHLHDIEGWYKPGFSLALEFGNVCHEVLERVWRGDRGRVTDFTTEHEAACRQEYLDNGATAEELEWMYGVAYVTMEEFMLSKSADAFKDGKEATEERIAFEYEYPDGKVTTINGVIDLSQRLGKKKRLWIWDTKTSGEINADDYADEVACNFQLNVYALQKRLDGEDVAGVGLNVIRRSGIKPSAKTSETLVQMLDRLRADIKKRPDYYFHRFRHNLTKKASETWQRTQLDPIMADVRLWAEGFGEWYEKYPWFPRTPTYTNPNGLKVQRRKVDLYHALTKNDFTGLRKRGTDAS